MISVCLFFLSLCCWQAALTHQCTPGVLRVNGTNSTAGRLEICNSGQWIAIHDSQWDDRDAAVACHQLGFSREGATAYRKASFDPSIPSLSGYNLHLSGFTCSGTESRLISCGHISGGRYYHNNDAGIKCLLQPPCQPRRQWSTTVYTTGATIYWNSCNNNLHSRAQQYYVSCTNQTLLSYRRQAYLSGLSPNTQYPCYVYGIDNLGRLGRGADFTFTTSPTLPLCPPWNFRYTSLTNTSISLRWDPPPSDDRSGSVTRYNITFRCANYLHCSSTSTTTQTAYYSNTQLQPGRRYTIAVAPCSSQGCGTTSTVTLNMTTLVSVNNLRVRPISPTTAMLTWNSLNGEIIILYYLVRITNLNTTTREATRYIAGHLSSTVIDSLHPNHRYQFSIAAFTTEIGPYVSQEAQQPEHVPTGGPQNIDCIVHNLTTLIVSWTEPPRLEQNGPIEQYWVFLRNNDDDLFVYNNSLPSPSTVLMTSLTPYRNYICRVAAFARAGLGPFSSANAWLTDDAQSSEVVNLSVTDVNSTSISIEWGPPYTQHQSTRIQYYSIAVHDEDNRTVYQQTLQRFYHLTSLHPYYHHTITVAAVTNTVGPNTTVYTQTLEDLPSEAPRSLQVTKVSAYSVALAWQALPRSTRNGVIVGYTIRVQRMGNDTNSNYLTSEETFVTVSNLEDDTTYNFTVAANTTVGIGPYSIHVIAKTRNYALEVGSYTGGSLLIILLAIGVAVCAPLIYCNRRRIKEQCFSKRTKKSSDRSHDHTTGIDYKHSKHLRERKSTSKDSIHDASEAPQLPDREYLEDIDFVSKEFDLFFTRRPELPARAPDEEESKDDSKSKAYEDSCSKDVKNEQSPKIDKGTSEESHYMSLKKPPEESVYQQLTTIKKEPSLYANVTVKKEDSAKSHYQQLLLKPNESATSSVASEYQLLSKTKVNTSAV